MAGEGIDAAAEALARIAESSWSRRLVFQRRPEGSEEQTDSRGFPISEYTDIDPTHPIPCMFISQSGRKVVINEQEKIVTLYKFTVPQFYKSADGNAVPVWQSVGFSQKLRVHLLAKGAHPEMHLQITGGGEDQTPGLDFQAVRLEDLV